MPDLGLTLDTAWAIGFVLALTRVAAFVVAAPTLAKLVPMPGRLAFVIVVGLFLATPVTGLATMPQLVGQSLVNAAIGGILGFLTGAIFHMFAVAGGLVDLTSSLSVATVFDPMSGERSAVFGRLFHLTGLALFVVAGGLGALVGALAATVRAVPLDGVPHLSGGLAQTAVEQTGRLMVVGLEVAFPVVAVLFLTDMVLGVAARFAPQANVFLVGLPLKILVTLLTVSTTLLVFPQAVDAYLTFVRDTVAQIVRGLAP